MASSSSNPSSTSSSAAESSRPTPVEFPARILSETEFPPLGTNPAPACSLRRRRGRGGNSAGVSQPRNSGAPQHVSPSLESGLESAADPTSTFAPVMRSADTEGSSSSASAWCDPLASSSTAVAASTPTDTRTASASSSPSADSKLVLSASASASAVATSADTTPEPDAFTYSAPGVTRSAEPDLEPDATTSATPPAPGVATIVDDALEPNASASTPSSALLGVTTIADSSAAASAPDAAPTASATTPAPGAAATIASLQDSWVAERSGIPPRSLERRPEQHAFVGNDMSAVVALYPDPLWAWRAEVSPRSFGAVPLPPRSFGVPLPPLCWECRLRPARFEAIPCGHMAICDRCFTKRFVCRCCDLPVIWLP